jgi:cytochrome c-type biogenesis protein CcmH/NrfG
LREAEAALRDALGRAPDDALALYELGEVYARSEHYAGAAKFWLQVVDEDPKLSEKLQLAEKIRVAEERQ